MNNQQLQDWLAQFPPDAEIWKSDTEGETAKNFKEAVTHMRVAYEGEITQEYKDSVLFFRDLEFFQFDEEVYFWDKVERWCKTKGTMKNIKHIII